jgi:hypothetical protein
MNDTHATSSIRAELKRYLLPPLAALVIDYERLPGCPCYAFFGDTVPYRHGMVCRYWSMCFECNEKHAGTTGVTHGPTCIYGGQ